MTKWASYNEHAREIASFVDKTTKTLIEENADYNIWELESIILECVLATFAEQKLLTMMKKYEEENNVNK